MRIAFFSTMGGLPWGGSEELWSRAATALLAGGHEVAFNSPKWPSLPAPLGRLIEAGAAAHFRRKFRLGRTLHRTLESLKFVRVRYVGWLRRTRPDLAVISFSCHTDDPQIAKACRLLGIRYVIVLQAAGHSNWIAQRHLNDFRTAYASAERCYFVADENREVVQSNLGIDLSHSEIVDNPFNVRPDAAPAWPASEQPWKLACVARIHFPTKSQDLLMRVLRQPKWRMRPLTLTLWGSDDGFLPQLERLITLWGLGDKISYGGFATDVEALWSQHHGLLLPSRMEGNALSLIEAMLCGRVCITTKVGRAAELIEDRESGFLAPAATAELIDDVLERAWQRRHDWRAMGQQAARAIRCRHSLRPAGDFAERILDVATRTAPIRRLAA
jgi:glycosyltransferase involved in cell wall biosynthesis